MDQAEFAKKGEKVKSYMIILENSKGKIVTELVKRISFPEAASHAYLMKSNLGYDFKITSISEK